MREGRPVDLLPIPAAGRQLGMPYKQTQTQITLQQRNARPAATGSYYQPLLSSLASLGISSHSCCYGPRAANS